MRKIKYIALFIGIVALGYFYLCPKNVEVAKVTRGPAVKAIYATGTVENTEMLPISPRVAGNIAELLIDEGSKVKAGDILARLETKESDALLYLLKSKVDISKKDFTRIENLLKQSATTQELYDTAKSNLDIAEGNLKAEHARRDYLLLKAPKDGVIIKRDGELGQYMPTSQAIFWFSSNAPNRISAEVDEEDISQVKVGQKVLIRSDAFKDKVFEGQVSSITPKGDPIARSYRVRIAFTEEVPLLIGMTAENNIIIREETNAILVPSSALVKDSVWVVSDSKLTKRQVIVGAKGAEMSEILAGVSLDELVIITPIPDQNEGEKVRINIIEPSKK